jgi:hypothetical protein
LKLTTFQIVVLPNPNPHCLHTQADLDILRAYQSREDYDSYVIVLKQILRLFGAAMHESLTRTLGNFQTLTLTQTLSLTLALTVTLTLPQGST